MNRAVRLPVLSFCSSQQCIAHPRICFQCLFLIGYEQLLAANWLRARRRLFAGLDTRASHALVPGLGSLVRAWFKENLKRTSKSDGNRKERQENSNIVAVAVIMAVALEDCRGTSAVASIGVIRLSEQLAHEVDCNAGRFLRSGQTATV